MDTINYNAGKIATITLNRPEAHNAFNEQLTHELTNLLKSIDSDPSVRVVLLKAQGRHFCAGADLNWMKKISKFSFEKNKTDALQLAGLLHCLSHLGKPTLAVTQGHTMGGGCGLAAACDMVFAEQTAQFCFSEVKLGLIPATIAPYIVRRTGLSLAKRYFLSAEQINAEKARFIGLIDEIRPKETLLSSALSFAEDLLQHGPNAMRQVKNLLNTLYPIDADTREITATLLATCRSGQEAQTGLTAFFTKQKPAW